MLDLIEYRIAANLSERHLYPYSRDIYINIFRHFSHFPIRLADLGVRGDGQTITFLAYVVMICLERKPKQFLSSYQDLVNDLQLKVKPFFPFPIAVETFLGCMLYFHHPVDIRNALSSFDTATLFNAKEKYEYDLKKNTILIHAI
jgi:hypothetical protein